MVRRMFLILHDPFTGKPQISRDLLTCGLVAAALADLMIAHRLGMENDRIVVAEARGTGPDEVEAFVMESIQRQTGAHTVRSWVEALQDVLFELVARDLVKDRIVRREQGGRLLARRGSARFPALDLLRAAGPRLRLEHTLRESPGHDVSNGALAALIGALDAERVLDVDRDRVEVKRAVAAATDRLPIDLRGLVAGVRSAATAGSRRSRR